MLFACTSVPLNAPVPAPGSATSAPAQGAPSIPKNNIPIEVNNSSRDNNLATGIVLLPVSYSELPGWNADDFSQVWQAWLASCASGKRDLLLLKACAASQSAALMNDTKAQRSFFESQFTPHRVTTRDNKDAGLLTGYYEPVLKGSRTRSATFKVPLYSKPDDLLPLAVVNGVGGFQRSRRNAQGQVVPYWSRAEIESGAASVSLTNKAWIYLDDPIEALFLQIQGSGRVMLQDGAERGQQVRAAFADHNGHAFQSIGKWLIQRGELRAEDASMQSIKAWALKNPARLNELLAANPRYVFFREERITNPQEGPKGAMGVPLTAGRSIAVDTQAIAFGLPVWIDSTEPQFNKPLQRLTFAQDVGAAITGNIRADFYWGTGNAAGEQAGRTKQPLRLFVLIPRP